MQIIDDLKETLHQPDTMFLLGAGVSLATTTKPDTGPNPASWTGLLETGIQRCEQLDLAPTPGWGSRLRECLEAPDIYEVLSVASRVAQKLGAPDGGEFSSWLRKTVGSLKVENDHLISLINSFPGTIATTNYDTLVQQSTGLRCVTWRASNRFNRILRQDEAGVLHLHGMWEDPESVILSEESYRRHKQDAAIQHFLRSMRSGRTMIFIGFGAGLSDPNFRPLLQWGREAFSGDEYRHYRLVTAAEKKSLLTVYGDELVKEYRIMPVEYGEDHGDLPVFLEKLAAPRTVSPKMQLHADGPGPEAKVLQFDATPISRSNSSARKATSTGSLQKKLLSKVFREQLSSGDVTLFFGNRIKFSSGRLPAHD